MNNLSNYGQHFLTDQKVIADFLAACNLSNKETVLEIGPGQGALTTRLCGQAKQVVAVEIDSSLKPELAKLEHQHANLKVIFANALKVKDFNYDLVCGALSFAIFEPLLIRLIRFPMPGRLVFLVSYKVKQDFDKQQGLLFYLLNAFFTVEFGHKILPQAFSPKPRTAGVIMKLFPCLPKDRRWQEWRRRFLTDKTIWQKTVPELQEIDC